MKRILVKKQLLALLLSQVLFFFSYSQNKYWQQEVNYTIDVSLNDKEHTLTGFEKIEYINHSPDTLKFIWFHIWPNAYKNDKTAFSDQLLENGSTRFYFSNAGDKGYINRLDFKVDNVTAGLQDHPEHIDIVKLILPAPLLPGQSILITTPFHVKLPFNFSRGGHDGESYQVTQWYPRPAVYDKNGWHPMTYLDQGEFYSEFGSFDVSITVPENYVVAATGELQNDTEKEWLKTRASFTSEIKKEKVKTRAGGYKTVMNPFPPSSNNIKKIRFRQNNIHDFAWFADKRFRVKHDTCRLNNKIVDVYSYFTFQEEKYWSGSLEYLKRSLRHYSTLVGEYPYAVASVVQGPESFGGGMEYPTIAVISPTRNVTDLDVLIAHEIGHNWFYGALGSNERDHPWMDEGLNSYYDHRYRLSRYGRANGDDQKKFEIRAVTKTDQPIIMAAADFNADNYDLVAYYKTAEWLRYLELQLGVETMNKIMQEYFRLWKFKHPQPEDFKAVVREVSGKDIEPLFAYQDKKGLLPSQVRKKGLTVAFGITGDAFRGYFNGIPTKSFLMFSPYGFGYNKYDGFMWGGIFTNIKIPMPPVPAAFEFLVVPMYAFGSKKFAGLGLARYNIFSEGSLRKITVGINAATFSMDRFIDDEGNKTLLGVHKFVPHLRLTKREKPRSSQHRYLQFKSFFISEEGLRFFQDTIRNPPAPDTVVFKYRTIKENRVLNQLLFVAENHRVLYPYRAELKIEQGRDFVRAAFTGNYFFNYASGGGLDVRVFGGKFMYLGSKTFSKQFSTDRYHLNMTGPNGYEDYTYSDYFAGRNEFEGTSSQQLMVRDGAFKVRTELLAEKVGKTDDWLIAANLSSGLPRGLNPFGFLPEEFPFKIKVFADIGTYAEPWKKNATGERFLFDGGFQLSILKETINIYLPLVYSKVFKDYIQSTLPKKNRLLKTMSFSINLSNFSFRKINRKWDF